MAGGRFIKLEGGEGVGKSTQVRRLAETLRAHDLTVVLTREPGGSPAAERVRTALLGLQPSDGAWTTDAECLLHYAARSQHVADVVSPAIGRGDWVISDRFADSTAVYQGVAGGGDPARIRALHDWTFPDAPAASRPDLTLILDIDVADGRRRAAERGGALDVYERRPDAFHQRVRDGFLAIAAAEPDRCAVIDATPPPDEVAASIAAVVTARFDMPSGGY